MSENAGWPEQHEVRDPAAIALLTDMRAVRYLLPFLRAEHTLTSAAHAVGTRPSTVAYWVPKLLAARLVECRRTDRRRGAPSPVYRATAQQFTVPLDLIPLDARVALFDAGRLRVLRRFLDGLDETLARPNLYALAFSAPPERGMSIQMVESDSVAGRRRDHTDGWMSLLLTVDDATELAAAMEELLQRYVGRSGPRTYLVHGGIAPEARHPWRSINDV